MDAEQWSVAGVILFGSLGLVALFFRRLREFSMLVGLAAACVAGIVTVIWRSDEQEQILGRVLEAFLSGPVMAASVAVTFFALFRVQLGELILRLRRLRIFGQEADFPEQVPPTDEQESKSEEFRLALEQAQAHRDALMEQYSQLSGRQAESEAARKTLLDLYERSQAAAKYWRFEFLRLALTPASIYLLHWARTWGTLNDPNDIGASLALADSTLVRQSLDALRGYHLLARSPQTKPSPEGEEFLNYLAREYGPGYPFLLAAPAQVHPDRLASLGKPPVPGGHD